MNIIEERSYGVIAVLRGQGDKFLILKGAIGEHWAFSKGHAEKNETIKETAVRELKEETGISDCNILDLPLISEEYSFTRDNIEHNKIVQYFIGFVDSDVITLQKEEIAQYKWLNYQDALATLTFDGNKKTLEKAKDFIENYRSVVK